MPRRIFGNRSRIFLVKFRNWVKEMQKPTYSIRFIDPEIFYIYSSFHAQAFAIPPAEKSMICSVGCTFTIYNEGKAPQAIRNAQLSAIIGTTKYPMHLLDKTVSPSPSIFILPPKGKHRVTWTTFVKVIGDQAIFPETKDITLPDFPVAFEFLCCDKWRRQTEMMLEVDQTRMLSYSKELPN